ncbi:hypothetical protein BV25DRAFT_1764714, partial [Artomyces pyxidatus]
PPVTAPPHSSTAPERTPAPNPSAGFPNFPYDVDSDKWPPWLADSVKGMKALSLGETWERCVSAYVHVERVAGFLVSCYGPFLTAKDRPAFVSDWIKYARPWGGELWSTPFDFKVFPGEWWAWWAHLQPDGRSRNAAGVFSQDVEGLEWDRLRIGGRNGVLSVMAGLAWWGRAASRSQDPAHLAEWMRAAAEASWAM